MSESDRDEDRQASKPARRISKRRDRDKPMEDEEKILAGRADVNMPALLTKDVKGG